MSRRPGSVPGALSLQGFRGVLEALGYRVEFQVYAPGTLFPAHAACADRVDGVLLGCLRLQVGGDTVDLGPGEWLETPGGCTLEVQVMGEVPVLALDGIRWDRPS